MYMSAQQLFINSLATRMSLNCELSAWQIYASFFFSLVGKICCGDFLLLLGFLWIFFFLNFFLWDFFKIKQNKQIKQILLV